MFKRRIITFLIIIILISFALPVFAQNTIISSNFDISGLNNGLININYNHKTNNKMKVMISKGDSKYTYDLKSNNSFPLQLGNGKYTISILENVEGNKYRLLEKEDITLKLEDSNKVYLQSIQLINWNENMEAIKKAKELTENVKNDKEKVEIIYSYIVKNISYDNEKAKNVQAGYVPTIDETLKSSKGICYDYSALLAGMLRSVGVPTKLVMGRKNDIKEYHAWNQVYLKETKQWLNIDTTYDSAYVQNNRSIPMIKNSKEYSIEKEY